MLRSPSLFLSAPRFRRAAGLVLPVALAALLAACESPPPVVNVETPPCECACRFKATQPQIGKGCWVNGDVLVCPLVRRTLDIEPAYPGEDPRCETLESGEIRCEIHPGDTGAAGAPGRSAPPDGAPDDGEPGAPGAPGPGGP